MDLRDWLNCGDIDIAFTLSFDADMPGIVVSNTVDTPVFAISKKPKPEERKISLTDLQEEG